MIEEAILAAMAESDEWATPADLQRSLADQGLRIVTNEEWFERGGLPFLDVERLDRAQKKFSPEDAFLLRTTVHGWAAVDEVTIFGPAGLVHQILAALDALAIVHDSEKGAAEQDAMLRQLNKLEG